MSARNTSSQYGWVARFFHWTTAALILTAIPLGLYANALPYDTAEALAQKAQVFSIHKTLGIAAFFVALGRILWALTNEHPEPLNPDRRGEQFLARLVHWALYISMLAVPLSGWIHHAAVTGFAPILWPFGQDLPFVPKSEALAALAAGMHWIFTKLLAVSIVLHIAGAMKHHLIDRDATLRRMTRGEAAAAPGRIRAHVGTAMPAFAAVALFAIAGGTIALPQPDGGEVARQETPAVISTPVQDAQQTASGNWQVAEGTLGLTVRQMGQEVAGSFARWQADIAFSPEPTDGRHGTVTVRIDTGSLSLGSVTQQALGAEFFDVASHPEAVFTAEILPADQGYLAKGTLTLRGVTVPVDLPFTLDLQGDSATMSASLTLDRRSFGMGQSYGDETSVGFAVDVAVDLVADRLN